jgi:excisionase family DNA binding protein
MKRMIAEGDIVAGRTSGNHYRIDRESIDKHFGKSEEKSLALLRSLGL